MLADVRIARALTWRYGVALTLVAALATAAWVSLHLVISKQESVAAVVNVSGRQRMLSQRTALFASLLVTTPPGERPAVRAQLREAADLMQRSHRGLIAGDEEMRLPAAMSDTIRAMYFDGSHPLGRQVEAYLQAVRALLDLKDGELTPDHPLLQYIIKVSPNRLVADLDRMVGQYQLEGEAAIKRLQKAETVVWLLTLLLLALEAAFIFQPFSRHVRTIIGKLRAALSESRRLEGELRKYQGNLEELVRQRTRDLEKASADLAESEEKFRLISTSAKDAILIIDEAETIVYWNPAAVALFGYAAEEALGKNLPDLLAPSRNRDDIRSGFAHFRATGTGMMVGRTIEVDALRQGGEEFPVELSISALWLGGRIHTMGMVRDITERKRAEAQDHLLVTALEAVGNGVVITDAGGTIEWANPSFGKLTGYSRDEAIGHRPAELVKSGLHPSAFYEDLWRTILAGETWRGEVVNRRKDGSLYDEELLITPVKDPAGTIRHFVAIKQDVSERKRMEAELRDLATTDPLTGLPNRRHFLVRLEEQLARVHRMVTLGATVLMVDLDHFKQINDTHGHAVGDAVLAHVAALMRDGLRKVDTVGRMGGEEFAFILPGTDVAGARVFAERLRQKVEGDPLRQGGLTVPVTVSIGIAVLQGSDASADASLVRADEALYQAKAGGRNRVMVAGENAGCVTAA